MKVVLLKNIPSIGKIGDVREVKEGYAKNFLIPKKLAEAANQRKVQELSAKQKKEEKKKKSAEKNKQRIASNINGKTLKLKLQADNTGTLYKKLTARYIVSQLKKSGLDITEKELVLNSPIKKTGEYTIELRMAGSKPKIKILINK